MSNSDKVTILNGNGTVVNATNPLPVSASFSGNITANSSANATAADPTYSEGTSNPLSQDLSGHLRVVGNISATTTAEATAAAPSYTEGTANPLSQNLAGSLRTLVTGGNLTSAGNVTVTSGNIAVSGAVTVSGSLTSAGNVTNAGTFAVQVSAALPAGANAIGAVTISGANGTLTARSGNITAGGTSQQLAASNSTRKYLLIQNPSTASGQGIVTAESLFVRFGASAAGINNGTSFELTPGGVLAMESSFIDTEAVQVNATTTSHRWIAVEG